MKWRRSKIVLAAGTAMFIAFASPSYAFFGVDGKATEITQLMNNAELLLIKANQLEQIQHQIEMLMGFDVNNAAGLMMMARQARSILGQLEGIVYDVGAVVGIIEHRYPHTYGRGTTLQDLLRHSEAWREVERNAFVESHRLQSQIAEAMEEAAARDAATLDAAMAAPGIRAAIQAGNQLTGSLITEVRTLQMAHIAHARAVETQQLRDTAADAQGRQAICDFFKDTPSARVSWCE